MAHLGRVGGDVVVEPDVLVRQRAWRGREDPRPVHTDEGGQGRVAVGGQEVLPRPRRQVQDLRVQERLGNGTPKRRPARSARTPVYDAGRTVEAAGIDTHGCARQKSPRVSASSATITSRTSSRSAIVRVCGTTTSIVGTRGQFPRTEITPREGVYAHSALQDAGARPLDHVSSPNPNAAKLAAVAVPDPFEDPEANALVRKSAL